MRARRLVQRLGCVLAGTTLAAGTLLSATPAPQASASTWNGTSFAVRLLQDMNYVRAHRGLPPLSLVYGLSVMSGHWSSHMAATSLLQHNPNLVSQANTLCPRWTVLGENVGDGYNQNPDALFQAYWNSLPHRANMLNRSFRYVGVTAVFKGLFAWNTVDFSNAC